MNNEFLYDQKKTFKLNKINLLVTFNKCVRQKSRKLYKIAKWKEFWKNLNTGWKR